MEQPKTEPKGRYWSPFKVILTMITLMVVGLAMIPLLNVQYMPTTTHGGISISYWWQGASAKVVEAEVTSKIEGVAASIAGVSNVGSASGQSEGNVWLSFKKGTNIDAARFELSSKIRSLYPKLPHGVSYPWLSTGVRGDSPTPILTYTINADLPTWEIQRYTERTIQEPLSLIEGVDNVAISGATPYEWELLFDADRCAMLGVSSDDISNAFKVSEGSTPIGVCQYNGHTMAVNFGQRSLPAQQWEQIEVKNIDGHIVMLGDIATITHRQQPPQAYNRINGLNNINITIYAAPGVNNLTLATQLKEKVDQMREHLPHSYAIILADDTTQYIKQELSKIYWRTGLSVLILLLFVLLTSRSWRYLLMIAVTLTANILIAFIFYNLLSMEIHLYSLAGITVSLGMIIDTSIIMLDHYSHFKNRRVFLAILAALLTTIGALSIVYFLPEGQRQNLIDFSLIIIINLSVSLVISALFIPALLDKFPLRIGIKRRRFGSRGARRKVRFSHFYARFLSFGRRWRWAFIVLAILGFGLPVHMLPTEIGDKDMPKDSLNAFQKRYNATLGGTFYQQKVKPITDVALGGSLRLFAKDIFSSYQSSDPERTRINIRASLPAGCTIHQLNAMMVDMENYLTQFEEIELFRTSINSYDNGSITVTFTPEADKAGFAFKLKDLATSKALSLGGADWSIYGVGQGFSNSLNPGWKSNAITLKGYNYDLLYALAQELCDSISVNPRVSGPVVAGQRWETDSKSEFFITFNFERFALYNISPADYFRTLSSRLYSNTIAPYYDGSEQQSVVLTSSQGESFDVWHMSNDMLIIGDKNVKLSELGTITKVASGNNIYKNDQQYTLTVAFDFVGSYELASRFEKRHIERLKATLPVGYSVEQAGYGWWGDEQGLPYKLLGLIAVIIFFICAVLFESLRQPLVIISMIPISFIGVFLTFSLFKLPFDQGGFASFVLLSGTVVNAGIYLVNEYNNLVGSGVRPGLHTYIRAYDRKIIPIILTVLSTVLGLIPFVVISREPFWFSFATGAMGGMLFSIIAIIVFLPIFLPLKKI